MIVWVMLIILLLKLLNLNWLLHLSMIRVSESDKETMNQYMTGKDYKALSRKLNMIVRHGEAFYSSNFQNMMLAHEATIKTLFSESKHLFEKNENVVKDNVMKMETSLQEVKDLKTLMMNVKNSNFTNSINYLVKHYDIKVHLSDEIQRKDVKINSMNKEVSYLKSDQVKKDDELLLVKGLNFGINR